MKTRNALLAAAFASLGAFASFHAAAQYDSHRRTPPPMIIEPETVSNNASHSVTQAEARKFISVGMYRSAVLAQIGEPNRQIVNRVTHIAAQSQVIEAHVDIYEPTAGDPQTRTEIRYRADVVDGIDRRAAR